MGGLFFPDLFGEGVKITHTSNGLNTLFAVRQWAELPAKIAHMNVNAAIEWSQIAPEHLVGKIIPGDDDPSRMEENPKQIELRGGEFNFCV
jgi:hypothetical protein